ncbi:MAG: PspC domain-containing protein [Bacteroidetes bacterium QS_7_67_15]|nr:MAG: PspC domain-containing protein [Bacteroidetes bacterium QS_7_67_15]
MQERGTPSTSRRLTRSTSDRKVAGVCGGLAAHLDIDSTVVRFAVLVALLATSVAPVGLAYLALAYLLPRGPDAATELASEERLRIIRES